MRNARSTVETNQEATERFVHELLARSERPLTIEERSRAAVKRIFNDVDEARRVEALQTDR